MVRSASHASQQKIINRKPAIFKFIPLRSVSPHSYLPFRSPLCFLRTHIHTLAKPLNISLTLRGTEFYQASV
ncbi:MAG: hypothetical protein K0Q79_1436 [Flavipsychrobacter sp.]|jgi:hypothetical protein|nr:hypothetical protein [Flavipsychrobacter sp.]